MTEPSTAETFLTRLIDARVEAHLDARGIGKHRCVPTQDAYDTAVAALNKHRERADVLADLVDVVALQVERMPLDMPSDAYRNMLESFGSRMRAAQMRDQIARQSPPAVAMDMLREKEPDSPVLAVACPACSAPQGVWCFSIGGNPRGWLHEERERLANARDRGEIELDPLWVEIAADHIGEKISDWPRHVLTAAARAALLQVLPKVAERYGVPAAAPRFQLTCGTCYGKGEHDGADCGSCSIRAPRCSSCDHLMSGHQDGVCWYTVTHGQVDMNLVCPCGGQPAADAPPFQTIEMRADNGVFTRVEVLGENVAATGNGMAVLSPWAAEVVGNGYLAAARKALANAGDPPRPADGCSRCGGLEGNHIFRDCPGRNS